VARILWASSPACFRLVASLRLSGAESCRECLDHRKTSGHFPSESFGSRYPVSASGYRFCGECGIKLLVSSLVHPVARSSLATDLMLIGIFGVVDVVIPFDDDFTLLAVLP
jgi:hypothetical protein